MTAEVQPHGDEALRAPVAHRDNDEADKADHRTSEDHDGARQLDQPHEQVDQAAQQHLAQERIHSRSCTDAHRAQTAARLTTA